MPKPATIYDYMRAHAAVLGERILQEYPALHQFDDPVSPRIAGLLRKPFPAQTIAHHGSRQTLAAGADRHDGRGMRHRQPLSSMSPDTRSPLCNRPADDRGASVRDDQCG
jgi:hypothetical protein